MKFLIFFNKGCKEHPFVYGGLLFCFCMIISALIDLLCGGSINFVKEAKYGNIFISLYGATLYVLMARQIQESSEEELKDPDLFEDFTTVRWVKWTKRKPETNGIVWMRFNDKNTGKGHIHNGILIKLEGLADSEIENMENTFYWLEEIINEEGYDEAMVEYCEKE